MKTFVLFLAMTTFCSAAENSQIRLGALLTEAKTADPDTHAAIQLALRDFKEANPSVQVNLEVVDTSGSVAQGKAALGRFASQGIHLVIGPETSSEAQALLPEASRLGITLLSHCSSAPSLAAKDQLFRLIPDDRKQAQALATQIFKSGRKILIPLWLDGTWGDDYEKALRKSFTALGGKVGAGVQFKSGGSKADAVKKLNQQVGDSGPLNVAVAFLMFGDNLTGFLSESSKHSNLQRARWYGTEDTALDRDLLKDPKAAHFAIQTKFSAPLFASADSPKRYSLQSEIEKTVPGAVHACAFVAYDAFMIAAQVVYGASNAKEIPERISKIAAQFSGVTGKTDLNEEGDRKDGTYAFWRLTEDGASFYWDQASPEF